MAPALEVVRPRTPDEKFADYLNSLDDDKLGCKAERKHRMPRLKPGHLPKDIDVRRRRGGFYEIVGFCSECGILGTLTTGKSGILDGSERWEYDYTTVPGYLAPPGTGRSRSGEYHAELGERVAPSIREAAAVTASREAAAKRTAAAQRAEKTPKARRPGNQHGTNPRSVKHQKTSEPKVRHEWEQSHPNRGNGVS